jgi:hypothetical protein
MKTLSEIETLAIAHAHKVLPNYNPKDWNQVQVFDEIKYAYIAGFIEGEAHIINNLVTL